MKWILEPKQRVQIVFEPFGTVITLNAIYKGKQKKRRKNLGKKTLVCS